MPTRDFERYLGLHAVLALLSFLLPVSTVADVPVPTFSFGSRADVKAVEWGATAQAGLATSTGNSQTLSLSFGATIFRRSGDDRLSADISGAFVRTRMFVASEQNGVPGLGPGDIREVDQTTTEAWSMLGRYDRFVAQKDALYVSGSVAADEPAGKKLLAGVQLGYRRTLFLRIDEPPPSAPTPQGEARQPPPRQELVLEAGYDFAHQTYVSANPSIVIHSGRLFLGFHADPRPQLALDASVELLTNLNSVTTPTGPVDSLYWNRVTGVLAATTKLAENGGLSVRFSAHYDSVPAPRPPPAGFNYETGYVPLADRVDTKTELILVWRLM